MMTDSKETKSANTGKKDDNSLLVALTVTSIGAAAVIGYVAGQVRMAEVVFDQVNMMISSTPETVEVTDDKTMGLSADAYKNLVAVCESIDLKETAEEVAPETEAQ